MEEYILYGDDDDVRADSFLILSDMISLLSPNLINHTPTFKPIVISPSIDLQDHCTTFVLQYVFTEDVLNINNNKKDEEINANEQEDTDAQSEEKIKVFQKKREVSPTILSNPIISTIIIIYL